MLASSDLHSVRVVDLPVSKVAVHIPSKNIQVTLDRFVLMEPTLILNVKNSNRLDCVLSMSELWSKNKMGQYKTEILAHDGAHGLLRKMYRENRFHTGEVFHIEINVDGEITSIK